MSRKSRQQNSLHTRSIPHLDAPVSCGENLTQNLLQLHDAGVGADVLDGLGLPLVHALLEHLIVGSAILLLDRHVEERCSA